MTDLGRAPFRGDWKWLLLFSILLILAGSFAINHPLVTAVATSVLFSALLMVTGIASLATGFMAKGAGNRWIDIVFGVLAIIGGVLTFGAPVEGALSLTWALGALYAVSGVFELAAAFNASAGRGWLIVQGIVDVAIGGWIMVLLPGAALLTLAVVVGLGFIFRGIMAGMLAFQLRKLAG